VALAVSVLMLATAACRNDLGKVEATVSAQRCPEPKWDPAPTPTAQKFEADQSCFVGGPTLLVQTVITEYPASTSDSKATSPRGRTLWAVHCDPKQRICWGAAMHLNSIDLGLPLTAYEMRIPPDIKVAAYNAGVLVIQVTPGEHLNVDLNTGGITYRSTRISNWS
jgi:hypothetical protein